MRATPQRVEVDPDGEGLGGGEHADHRARLRVPELAGEVVRGGQRPVVRITEIDDQ